MKFVYSDGGRSKYFEAHNVRDCVCRAICNASGMDYKVVYDRINELEKSRRVGKHEHRGSARGGVRKSVLKYYLEQELGFKWVSCMGIGTGCKVHVDGNELPKVGSYILNLSGHLSCIKDGVLYDIYDCSRDGNRCVYGYWAI